MGKILVTVLAMIVVGTFQAKAEAVKVNDKPLAELKKDIYDGKAILIDVREKGETDAGYLKHAKLIPLSALKKDPKAAAELPKDKPIYTYCAAGVRSKTAAEILAKQGYQAINVKEGIDDLMDKGFEVHK